MEVTGKGQLRWIHIERHTDFALSTTLEEEGARV
jgi:cell division protein FtsW (lipid II flippase)